MNLGSRTLLITARCDIYKLNMNQTSNKIKIPIKTKTAFMSFLIGLIPAMCLMEVVS